MSGKLTLEPVTEGEFILHIGKYKVRVCATDEHGTQFPVNAEAALHNMVVVYNEDQSEKEDMSCDNTM